jgi:hypothetical protein
MTNVFYLIYAIYKQKITQQRWLKTLEKLYGLKIEK